jgi:hypothetical protein
MVSRAALGALCAALGFVPSLASARATFSGSYTFSENRSCPTTGFNAFWTGSVTLTPVVGTSGGTTRYDVIISWLIPGDAPLQETIADGVFQINRKNIMDWYLWETQKLHVTFGPVQDGIAQSAVAIGFTNGCAAQATFTRIGP